MITRDWATGTMAEIYKQQVEQDQKAKADAREQAGNNVIVMAYNHGWPRQDLIMVLQLLGLDQGWISDKIAAADAAEPEHEAYGCR